MVALRAAEVPANASVSPASAETIEETGTVTDFRASLRFHSTYKKVTKEEGEIIRAGEAMIIRKDSYIRACRASFRSQGRARCTPFEETATRETWRRVRQLRLCLLCLRRTPSSETIRQLSFARRRIPT